MSGARVRGTQIIVNLIGKAVVVNISRKLDFLRRGDIKCLLRPRWPITRQPDIIGQDFCRHYSFLFYSYSTLL